MPGHLAVFLPGFRLDRAGWDPRQVVVLVKAERGAERVQALSPVAAAAGVRPGMTLAEARSHAPELAVERLDAKAEARDLAELARMLERFSPQVEAWAPDVVTLVAEPEVLAPVRAAVAEVGHAARLVWAPKAEAARILARYAERDRVLRDEDVPAALAPLPLVALGLPDPVLLSLHDVGIRTVGAFAALPLAALSGRYGAQVLPRHALARGVEPPPVQPLPPPDPERSFTVELPDPVESLDALLFVLNGLCQALCDALSALPAGGPLGAALVRLQLRIRLEEGEIVLAVRLGRPGRSPERLYKVLRSRLERVTLPSPALSVTLEILDAAPFAAGQVRLQDRQDGAESLPDLLARLQDTLGDEVVARAEPADTWRPEEAWRALPLDDEGDVPDAPVKEDPAAAHEPVVAPAPRPVLLLPAALPLRVAAAPSGRPRALHLTPTKPGVPDWRKVVEAEGPERLWGQWWGDRTYARDYWRVGLEDGRQAWVYAEEGRWYLHGWFDDAPADGWALTPPPPGTLPRVVDLVSRRPRPPRRAAAAYAELVCRSNFSFCEGASHPEELVRRAKELGHAALAVTDRDGLYGAVQAHRAAKEAGLPLIHGSLLSVCLPGESRPTASVVALVQDLRGWASLCRLLTTARLGGAGLDDVRLPPELEPLADELRPPTGQLFRPGGVQIEKGWSALPFAELLHRNEGLLLLVRGAWPEAPLRSLREAVGDRMYRAVSRRLTADETSHIDAWAGEDLPAVAVGDVLMHDKARRDLQDVLTCIRLGIALPDAGRRLQPNAERVLAAPGTVVHRFGAWPALVERTLEIAGRCAFSLSELRYSYPRELVPPGYTPIAWLQELTRRGLRHRYPGGAPERVRAMVDYELAIINRLDFASYFLTVSDLVDFARSRGILCQGRGSAANSAVCYVLGVTSVDPSVTTLLFERFISEERGEPPDIDVDFEHERREEVLQYAYLRYGRDRAAMVNEIIAWRGKSAVRDVGRALGYDVDQVDRLAKVMGTWGEGALDEERIREAGFVPGDPMLAHLSRMVEQIRGFPRHTSIHVGGFVLSDPPLVDIAPVEPARMPGRTVLQWDKNDVDELGLVKVDLLSLGMLTAIRKCFDLVRGYHGVDLDLASVPREDPAVYDMLCEADSIGVFQVESRAQQSMLPRLRPRCFYDLVVETAIVRPGPIQGGMVHPYLRRRNGEEPITYAHPLLEPILKRTMGVPIFQEQVMAMAVAVGGFTPGESDRLRRAMGAWRKRGGLGEIGEKLMAGMRRTGIEEAYAQQIFKQIQGFAEYGFPESHAASFAHLVYVSSWQRCHYPAAFCAALLNSQPMGFYAPRTLVADVQRHGVEVREVDVRRSDWDNALEPGEDGRPAIRLGLRQIRGLKEVAARRIEAARRERPFASLPDLAARAGLDAGALRLLARADALRALVSTEGQDPVRAAVWAVEGLWPGLFAAVPRAEAVPMPLATDVEVVQADYAATGLSLKLHPIATARDRLRGVLPLAKLVEVATGTRVRVAGLVSHRQRPGTASGVVFMTLEDETGSGNIVVWPKVYEKQRKIIRGSNLLVVSGKVERQGQVINVIADRFRPLELQVRASSRDFR